ncbi:MAG: sigma-70 family RNA polymerase sigma factor [Bacilli bacterium]|nr:sigma-70 family RNA polymerase sigma factor [Bacilli bacterium]
MKHESINKYIVNNELDLDSIIDNYTHYINKVINNMFGNNLTIQDKEEILIDTFFVLWKNYTDNKEIKILDSYLAGISKNLTKNKLKSIKIQVNFDDIEMLEKYSIYDNYDDDNYMINLLYQSVNKLSQKDQDIVNLYYYSSKSIKEIANILNMSETNIKIKLFRIRKKLNKEIRSELKL